MEPAGSLVVLLTGAPGAGKSETLTLVHDELGAEGIDSAAIEADELARSYPPTDEARRRDHLRALAASFRDAGHDLLLVAATAESEESLSAWLDALGPARRLLVHLIASPETLERRVREREPAGWFGLADLLDSASRLASLRFASTDLELDTESRRPEAVADAVVTEIRGLLGGERR